MLIRHSANSPQPYSFYGILIDPKFFAAPKHIKLIMCQLIVRARVCFGGTQGIRDNPDENPCFMRYMCLTLTNGNSASAWNADQVVDGHQEGGLHVAFRQLDVRVQGFD